MILRTYSTCAVTLVALDIIIVLAYLLTYLRLLRTSYIRPTSGVIKSLTDMLDRVDIKSKCKSL